jgi:serine/threonine protein kinase
MNRGRCPTSDELSRYTVGKLARSQRQSVEDHLEFCPDCQSRLEALPQPADVLAAVLAHPVAGGSQGGPGIDFLGLEKVRLLGRQILAGSGCYAQPASSDFQPPARIGPYQMIKQIGAGGMGTVWMAEQTSPVKRIVAIKLIKPGMDSAQVLARFEAERQALALMDHPNIARVIDAGTVGSGQWAATSEQQAEGRDDDTSTKKRPPTASSLPTTHFPLPTISGRPYFVMEFVQGKSITTFCNDRCMPIRARLELFLRVCDAIQHAHHKGIIHRDLKPSNILVSNGDGPAIPKVIDFGVAKAVGPRLTETTLHTDVGQLMGTLEYMSPEQAAFNAVDIDTRSDVYALGALLYELLTGTTPFTRDEIRQAPLTEALRLIGEVEPPRPSLRLSKSPADLAELARQRGTEPGKLPRLVRGELDWLVMKALEKDRGRRYDTVSAMGLDIQRVLRNEPIQAGPPSAWYRMRKFASRHKGTLLATALVLLTLVGGIVGTTLGLIDAETARDNETAQRLAAESERNRAVNAENVALTNLLRAEEERGNANKSAADALAKEKQARQSEAEARAILEFFQEHVLDAARPSSQFGGLGIDVTLRSALDSLEPRIGPVFKDQPLVEAFIRTTLGKNYHHAGENALAIKQLQQALALYEAKLGPEHPTTLATKADLALVYQSAGKLVEAVEMNSATLALCEARLGPTHPYTMTSMQYLASAYLAGGQPREAVQLFLKAVELRKANLGADHPNTLNSINSLANAYLHEGSPELAVPLLDQSLRLARAKLPAGHPTTLSYMQSLASAYLMEENRVKDALLLSQETLKLRQQYLGLDHRDTLVTLFTLAAARLKANQPREALILLEDAVPRCQKKLGPDHPTTLQGTNALAGAYQANNRLKDAVSLFEDTLKRRRAVLPADHPDTLVTLTSLAAAYRSAGRSRDAVPVLEEAYTASKTKLGRLHPSTLIRMTNLALVYKDAGKLDEALALGKETLELHRERFGTDHLRTWIVMNNLAGVYYDAGQFKEAEELLGAAAAGAREKLGPTHLQTLSFTSNQADCLEKLDLAEMAEPLRRELMVFWKDKEGPDSWQFAQRMGQLGSNLMQQRKFAEAEPLLREALRIGDKQLPDSWGNWITRSLLGSSLAGQMQFEAAETLLLQAHEGLMKRADKIPPRARSVLAESAQRIIDLYVAWDKPELANTWRQELAKLLPRKG